MWQSSTQAEFHQHSIVESECRPHSAGVHYTTLFILTKCTTITKRTTAMYVCEFKKACGFTRKMYLQINNDDDVDSDDNDNSNTYLWILLDTFSMLQKEAAKKRAKKYINYSNKP